MTTALEARNATVWRGTALAVDGVSLAVPRATWFGIIGANGSGKTSLLRGLAGRLPCQMEHCSIMGSDLTGSPRERARQIGFMVPAEALPEPLTCEQIFSLVESDARQWEGRIGAVWNAIGIDRLLGRRIGACSAGMRQRIAIGAALLTDAKIVILDEPFNWLDPVAAMDLRTALRTQVSTGLTLITALHDMITLSACDEGLLLGKGRVIEQISPDRIAQGRLSPFDFEKDLIGRLRAHSVPD
jgi:ABC-type multidrug transport system ATPase subunit